MNWDHVKATIKGMLKSWTAWVAAIVAALPEIVPILQQSFPDLAPFIPDALESPVMHLLALVMVILRIKTTTSLADKGTPKPPTGLTVQ